MFQRKHNFIAKAFFAAVFCVLLGGIFSGCDSESGSNQSGVAPAFEISKAMASGPKFVGNIIASSVPSNFTTYWNQVTPENSTKWGSVEQTQGVRNWSQADTAYNFAQSNGYPFRFHTLVWGSQEPSWIGQLSSSQQLQAVTDWIAAAGQRFTGSDFVDVVNEPLHQPASYRNAIGGDGSTGWDWIVWSFEQARNAFPNSKLCINEYGIISDPSAASRYVNIINILNNRGLIDGIGIQCHQFNMDTVSVSTMNQVLSTLAATGLPIYVTELDITGDGNDNTQYQRYQEKFPVLYENSNVKGITLWGYIEGQTWKNDTHLITSSGQERPALQWLKQYLSGQTGDDDDDDDDDDTVKNAFSTIEAENYSSTNSSSIEIVGTDNGGSGIGYIENGNTVTYSNVDFGSGASSFTARVASEQNSSIEVMIGSASGTLIGTISDCSTGSWDTYQEKSTTVSSVTGINDLVLVFSGPVNVDSFIFTTSTTGDDDDDDDDNLTVPGKIEAENYSSMSGIEVESCGEGGQNVGYIDQGDWIEYQVNVLQTGTYTIQYRVASQMSSGSFELLVNGSSQHSVSVPNTDDWQSYQTLTQTVSLSAGIQTLRLSCTGSYWNINWLEIR